MKLQLVPARQGGRWVRAGFAVFFKRPLAFAALFTLFLLFGLVDLLLSHLGTWLLLGSLPLVSLAFMLATHRCLRGQPFGPSVYVEPFRVSRSRTTAIVQMGVVYAAASLAIMGLSDAVDGGKFEALQDAMASGKGDAAAISALLADPQLQFGLLLRFGLATLLALPFWHAPALVHWGDLPMHKSLFFSSVACWRNMGAFVVYGLVWTGVIVAFGAVANLLAAVLAQPQLIAFVAVPAGLLFSTVFYTSLYFTVTDCFTVEPSGGGVVAPREEP